MLASYNTFPMRAVILGSLQGSHKLHPSSSAQQARRRSQNAFIPGLQANLEIQVGNFDVFSSGQAVDFTHQLRQLRTKRLVKKEDLLQENHNLVRSQVLDVTCLRLERRPGERLPLFSKLVDNINKRRVKTRLKRQPRCIKPFVPFELTQQLWSFRVGLEEVQKGCLEFIRIKRLPFEQGEILKQISTSFRKLWKWTSIHGEWTCQTWPFRAEFPSRRESWTLFHMEYSKMHRPGPFPLDR